MSKHGFVGVRKRAGDRKKPYYARLTVKGEHVYTGYHETPEAAAKEYEERKAARRLLTIPVSNRDGP